MTRLSSALSVVCLLLAGCRAVANYDSKPAGAGPNKMLDSTAVGKHRCEGGATTYSPFVVEWDATDLASFEAKAARDLVFVRYADCGIEMLYGCSDAGIPGRYGRYNEPHFTSGTVEGFTMKNEDELVAKLPLGAAAFSTAVKLGETLVLKYFVSGSVQATRDEVFRAHLADNNRCSKATHFVSGFNLGAFKLEAAKGQSGEVAVGFKNAGGAAKTSSDSENLKQAGLLESCETQAQRQCRVPIRLILQPLQEGEAPTVAAANTSLGASATNSYEDTPQSRAYKLRTSANEKEAAGDGAGCLSDIERARGLENNDQTRRESMLTESYCMMRTGRCDEGKQLMRDYMKMIDPKRKTTDAQIETSVKVAADMKCPSREGDSIETKMTYLYTQVANAQEKGDPSTCAAVAKDAEALLKKVDKKATNDRNRVTGAIMMASNCLATLERCVDAKKLWLRYYDLTFTDMKPAERKSTAEMTFANVPGCKGK